MEIRDTDKYCIITPLSPKLNERETNKIFEEIAYKNLPIAFNLEFVQDCTIEFIELIKKLGNISLFNIPSDIFAILVSMQLDKNLKLFVSEMDFLNNKHQLINRKFSVV